MHLIIASLGYHGIISRLYTVLEKKSVLLIEATGHEKSRWRIEGIREARTTGELKKKRRFQIHECRYQLWPA